MKKLMACILPFVFAICLGGCSSKSASIGIIGGADGPTAIFVTSRINWPGVCGFVGIIAVAIVVILMIRRKQK